jgi:hypothetical protein
MRSTNLMSLALYRAKLSHISAISHLTIEVDRKSRDLR